jgi:hypothetical protein
MKLIMISIADNILLIFVHILLLTLKTLLYEGANGIKCNVSNTHRNTCAHSYITADNSILTVYLILKVLCK